LADPTVPTSLSVDAPAAPTVPTSPSVDALAEAKGPPLAGLSLTEAPATAATPAFFWGTIDLTAPGFVGPPRDRMTIGLGPDNSLRYVSWKTLPMLPKSFGDADSDYPVSGSRTVVPLAISPTYTATVLDSSIATPDHFLLRYHVLDEGGSCDYIESTEGTRNGNGWSVVYSLEGKLLGAAMDAHAQGTLFPGDPDASVPEPGQASLWFAPVALSAPGFVGQPIDHLSLALDGNGQIRWFMFDHFVRRVSFPNNPDNLGPNALNLNNEGSVTFDDVIPATSSHFVIRYHVKSEYKQNDYTEGLEGTRQGDSLLVRYFISGKLWGSGDMIDGHSTGILMPASPGAH
jgi:hypothetical protein